MSSTLSEPTLTRATRSLGPNATDRIALINSWGTVVAVNREWSDMAGHSVAGLSQVRPGVNYLEVCRKATASCSYAREALAGIRSVLRKKTDSFVMDYAAPVAARPAFFRMAVMSFCHANTKAAIVHTDITELQLSKDESLRSVRDFARRLIHAQEEERERIAREIHDDLGNRVALLSFSFQGLMSRCKGTDFRIPELNDVMNRIADLSEALRHLSHGLHPHLLRQIGLCSALRVLCDEFSKTSGIQIDTTIPDSVHGLAEASSLCLFRVSQECLQNIAKHSEARTASVILEPVSRQIRLTVRDAGHGFVQSRTGQKGELGLISIKERVLSLGGQLKIRSAPGAGTEVQVTVPIAARCAR